MEMSDQMHGGFLGMVDDVVHLLLHQLPQFFGMDIGSAVGYENQLHFSRAFKGVYGVSPREWRNQHK